MEVIKRQKTLDLRPGSHQDNSDSLRKRFLSPEQRSNGE